MVLGKKVAIFYLEWGRLEKGRKCPELSSYQAQKLVSEKISRSGKSQGISFSDREI